MSNKTQDKFLHVWNYISNHFITNMESVDGTEKCISVSPTLAITRYIDEEKSIVLSIYFYSIEVSLYIDSCNGETRLVLDLPSHIDVRDFDVDRLLRDMWKEIRQNRNEIFNQNDLEK